MAALTLTAALRIRGAAVISGLAGLLLLSACTSAAPKLSSSPAVSKTVVEAAARAGVACHYLAEAEANPVGSANEVVGSMALAAAIDYAATASRTDARWVAFAADMRAIGKAGGQPALARVTKICHQWGVDPNYYTTHSPTA